MIGISSLVGTVPTIWLLFWPIYVAIWGPDSIARQSLMFIAFVVFGDTIKSKMVTHLPGVDALLGSVLDVAILATLVTQPYTLLPQFVLTIYELFLKYLGEPLLLILEVYQLMRFVRKTGANVSYYVLEKFEDVDAIKYLVLLATVVIYATSLFVLKSALNIATSTIFTHVALVLLVVNFVLTIATYISDEGVITNSAMVFFLSSISFYLASLTNMSLNSHFNFRNYFSKQSESMPFLRQLLELPELTTAFTNEIWVWLSNNFGVWFWALVFVRLVLFRSWICDEDDTEDKYSDYVSQCDEDNSFRTRFSNTLKSLDMVILTKVLTILIYSEMVIQRAPIKSIDDNVFFAVDLFCVARLFQSILFSVCYARSLWVNSVRDD